MFDVLELGQRALDDLKADRSRLEWLVDNQAMVERHLSWRGTEQFCVVYDGESGDYHSDWREAIDEMEVSDEMR